MKRSLLLHSSTFVLVYCRDMDVCACNGLFCVLFLSSADSFPIAQHD